MQNYITVEPMDNGKPLPVGSPIKLTFEQAEPLLAVRAIRLATADGDSLPAADGSSTDGTVGESILLLELHEAQGRITELEGDLQHARDLVVSQGEAHKAELQSQTEAHQAELRLLSEAQQALTLQLQEARDQAAEAQRSDTEAREKLAAAREEIDGLRSQASAGKRQR